MPQDLFSDLASPGGWGDPSRSGQQAQADSAEFLVEAAKRGGWYDPDKHEIHEVDVRKEPETKVLGFRDAWSSEIGDYLPFWSGANELKEMKGLYDAGMRIQAETATQEDFDIVAAYLEEANADKTWGYYFGSILSQLPAFAVEVWAGLGVARKAASMSGIKVLTKALEGSMERTASKAAGRKLSLEIAGHELKRETGEAARKKVLKEQLLDVDKVGGVWRGVGDAAIQGTASYAGAETVTTGLGLMTGHGWGGRSRSSAYQRAFGTGGWELSENEAGQLAVAFNYTMEDWLSKLPAGMMDGLIEHFSERMGRTIMEMPIARKIEAMQISMASKYMKKHGLSALEFAEWVSKTGWDGPIEEFLEERLGARVRNVLLVGEDEWLVRYDHAKDADGNVMLDAHGRPVKGEARFNTDALMPDVDQLIGEIAAFGLPGVAHTSLRRHFAKNSARGTGAMDTRLEGESAQLEQNVRERIFNRELERVFTPEQLERFNSENLTQAEYDDLVETIKGDDAARKAGEAVGILGLRGGEAAEGTPVYNSAGRWANEERWEHDGEAPKVVKPQTRFQTFMTDKLKSVLGLDVVWVSGGVKFDRDATGAYDPNTPGVIYLNAGLNESLGPGLMLKKMWHEVVHDYDFLDDAHKKVALDEIFGIKGGLDVVLWSQYENDHIQTMDKELFDRIEKGETTDADKQKVADLKVQFNREFAENAMRRTFDKDDAKAWDALPEDERNKRLDESMEQENSAYSEAKRKEMRSVGAESNYVNDLLTFLVFDNGAKYINKLKDKDITYLEHIRDFFAKKAGEALSSDDKKSRVYTRRLQKLVKEITGITDKDIADKGQPSTLQMAGIFRDAMRLLSKQRMGTQGKDSTGDPLPTPTEADPQDVEEGVDGETPKEGAPKPVPVDGETQAQLDVATDEVPQLLRDLTSGWREREYIGENDVEVEDEQGRKWSLRLTPTEATMTPPTGPPITQQHPLTKEAPREVEADVVTDAEVETTFVDDLPTREAESMDAPIDLDREVGDILDDIREDELPADIDEQLETARIEGQYDVDLSQPLQEQLLPKEEKFDLPLEGDVRVKTVDELQQEVSTAEKDLKEQRDIIQAGLVPTATMTAEEQLDKALEDDVTHTILKDIWKERKIEAEQAAVLDAENKAQREKLDLPEPSDTPADEVTAPLSGWDFGKLEKLNMKSKDQEKVTLTALAKALDIPRSRGGEKKSKRRLLMDVANALSLKDPKEERETLDSQRRVEADDTSTWNQPSLYDAAPIRRDLFDRPGRTPAERREEARLESDERAYWKEFDPFERHWRNPYKRPRPSREEIAAEQRRLKERRERRATDAYYDERADWDLLAAAPINRRRIRQFNPAPMEPGTDDDLLRIRTDIAAQSALQEEYRKLDEPAMQSFFQDPAMSQRPKEEDIEARARQRAFLKGIENLHPREILRALGAEAPTAESIEGVFDPKKFYAYSEGEGVRLNMEGFDNQFDLIEAMIDSGFISPGRSEGSDRVKIDPIVAEFLLGGKNRKDQESFKKQLEKAMDARADIERRNAAFKKAGMEDLVEELPELPSPETITGLVPDISRGGDTAQLQQQINDLSDRSYGAYERFRLLGAMLNARRRGKAGDKAPKDLNFNDFFREITGFVGKEAWNALSFTEKGVLVKRALEKQGFDPIERTFPTDPTRGVGRMRVTTGKNKAGEPTYAYVDDFAGMSEEQAKEGREYLKERDDDIALFKKEYEKAKTALRLAVAEGNEKKAAEEKTKIDTYVKRLTELSSGRTNEAERLLSAYENYQKQVSKVNGRPATNMGTLKKLAGLINFRRFVEYGLHTNMQREALGGRRLTQPEKYESEAMEIEELTKEKGKAGLPSVQKTTLLSKEATERGVARRKEQAEEMKAEVDKRLQRGTLSFDDLRVIAKNSPAKKDPSGSIRWAEQRAMEGEERHDAAPSATVAWRIDTDTGLKTDPKTGATEPLRTIVIARGDQMPNWDETAVHQNAHGQSGPGFEFTDESLTDEQRKAQTVDPGRPEEIPMSELVGRGEPAAGMEEGETYGDVYETTEKFGETAEAGAGGVAGQTPVAAGVRRSPAYTEPVGAPGSLEARKEAESEAFYEETRVRGTVPMSDTHIEQIKDHRKQLTTRNAKTAEFYDGDGIYQLPDGTHVIIERDENEEGVAEVYPGDPRIDDDYAIAEGYESLEDMEKRVHFRYVKDWLKGNTDQPAYIFRVHPLTPEEQARLGKRFEPEGAPPPTAPEGPQRLYESGSRPGMGHIGVTPGGPAAQRRPLVTAPGPFATERELESYERALREAKEREKYEDQKSAIDSPRTKSRVEAQMEEEDKLFRARARDGMWDESKNGGEGGWRTEEEYQEFLMRDKVYIDKNGKEQKGAHKNFIAAVEEVDQVIEAAEENLNKAIETLERQIPESERSNWTNPAEDIFREHGNEPIKGIWLAPKTTAHSLMPFNTGTTLSNPSNKGTTINQLRATIKRLQRFKATYQGVIARQETAEKVERPGPISGSAFLNSAPLNPNRRQFPGMMGIGASKPYIDAMPRVGGLVEEALKRPFEFSYIVSGPNMSSLRGVRSLMADDSYQGIFAGMNISPELVSTLEDMEDISESVTALRQVTKQTGIMRMSADQARVLLDSGYAVHALDHKPFMEEGPSSEEGRTKQITLEQYQTALESDLLFDSTRFTPEEIAEGLQTDNWMRYLDGSNEQIRREFLLRNPDKIDSYIERHYRAQAVNVTDEAPDLWTMPVEDRFQWFLDKMAVESENYNKWGIQDWLKRNLEHLPGAPSAEQIRTISERGRVLEQAHANQLNHPIPEDGKVPAMLLRRAFFQMPEMHPVGSDRSEWGGVMHAAPLPPSNRRKLKNTSNWGTEDYTKIHQAIEFVVNRHFPLDEWERMLAKRGVKIPREHLVKMRETLRRSITDSRQADLERTHFDPLEDFLKEHNMTMQDAADISIALHAPMVNAILRKRIRPELKDTPVYKKPSGLTEAECEDILSDARKKYGQEVIDRLSNEKKDANGEYVFDGLLQQIAEFTRKTWLDSGLITKGQYDYLRKHYPHYVPLRRLELLELIGMSDQFRDGISHLQGNLGRSRQVMDRIDTEIESPDQEVDNAIRNAMEYIQNEHGGGIDLKSAEYRPKLGGKRANVNPLALLMAQANMAIHRSQRAETGRAVLELVRTCESLGLGIATVVTQKEMTKLGMDQKGYVSEIPDLAYLNRPETIVVAEKGERKVILFDPAYRHIAESLKDANMHPAAKIGIVRGSGYVLRKVAGLLTRHNPIFALPNLFRDAGSAYLNITSQYGTSVAIRMFSPVRMAKAWRTAQRAHYRKHKRTYNPDDPAFQADPDLAMWEQYRSAGGPITFMDLGASRGLEDFMQRMDDFHDPATFGGLRWFKGGIREAFDRVDLVNDAIENISRFAFFSYAMEEGLPSSEVKGEKMDALEAAAGAKNLTVNFEKKGQIGGAMNALYMFSNANIQSTARLMGALFERGGNAHDIKMRGKSVQALTQVVGLHMSLAVINALYGGEDPDDEERYWDKRPGYQKSSSIILMDVWEKDGSGWSIPTPYGWNFFGAIGTMLGDWITGSKTPTENAGFLIDTALNSFNPTGAPNELGDLWVPTIGKPQAELARNRDWKGSPIYKDSFGDTAIPDSQLYFDNVNPLLADLTEWLNEKAGGNKYLKGDKFGPFSDINPHAIEHWMSFFGGGIAKELLRGYTAVDKWSEDREVRPEDIPLLRRFYFEESPYQAATMYRDRRSLLESYENMDENDLPLNIEQEAMLGMSKLRQSIDSDVKSIRQEIRQLDKEDDDYYEHLGELELDLQQAYNDFNLEWNRTKRDAGL